MTRGNIVHIEIPAAKTSKAAQFYKDLFGWKSTPMEGMDYILWEPGEGPGGAYNPLSEGVKPGEVLIYIDSDDIEADLIKAVKLGGALVREKTEIPGIGWFGLFKDPTGNTIAIFTSMDPNYNK